MARAKSARKRNIYIYILLLFLFLLLSTRTYAEKKRRSFGPRGARMTWRRSTVGAVAERELSLPTNERDTSRRCNYPLAPESSSGDVLCIFSRPFRMNSPRVVAPCSQYLLNTRGFQEPKSRKMTVSIGRWLFYFIEKFLFYPFLDVPPHDENNRLELRLESTYKVFTRTTR